jgi:predicted MPP superfamily phosphohydrolase
MSIFSIALLIFGVSQAYWGWRGYRFLRARIRPRILLSSICAAVLSFYFFEYHYNLGAFRERQAAVHLTWKDALLAAPFTWWSASSLVAFLLVLILAIPRGIVAGVRWIAARKRAPEPAADARGAGADAPTRRDVLETAASIAASAITAGPFVAGAYGLLYGRLNLEIKPQPIRLARLPRAFEGFRICQLSDIHVGSFMPVEEIRKYVAIANSQKPDMVVLTGDFVTFDPATENAAVEALRGLRAPYGVWGSLGNHDAWAGVEESISELFRQAGVRILRSEGVSIAAHGESFQLLGVDFESPHRFGPTPATPHVLADIEGLLDPHRVKILLSHNPDTFPRAAELGIDLSLAGHTHGGQAALEFISPEIAPSRLVTPYVAGRFERNGAQLYVNRGIGTVFVPIRLGAPPELTVYTLTRGA